MTKTEIAYSPDARKFLKSQPHKQAKRITDAVKKLPRGDTKKLKGMGTEKFRLRVGDYRVIYEVINKKHNDGSVVEELVIIYVEKIGNRGDIYK